MRSPDPLLLQPTRSTAVLGALEANGSKGVQALEPTGSNAVVGALDARGALAQTLAPLAGIDFNDSKGVHREDCCRSFPWKGEVKAPSKPEGTKNKNPQVTRPDWLWWDWIKA